MGEIKIDPKDREHKLVESHRTEVKKNIEDAIKLRSKFYPKTRVIDATDDIVKPIIARHPYDNFILPSRTPLAKQLKYLKRHFRLFEYVDSKSGTYCKYNGKRLELNESGYKRLRAEYIDLIKRYGKLKFDNYQILCNYGSPEKNPDTGRPYVAVCTQVGITNYVFYMREYMREGMPRAGIVIHEFFHGSIREFDYDNYYHNDKKHTTYPGPPKKALKNADSYVAFLYELLGMDYTRIVKLSGTTITAKSKK